MIHTNAWANPSSAGAQEALQMAAFLEERSQFPDQVQVNQALLAALHLQPGERVLEAGCGTGALARLAVGDLETSVILVGVDISPHLLNFARQTHSLDSRLHYVAGEAQRLPLASGSFDVAFAARLLLHVDDPLSVVRELSRAVRPAGRIVLMDWDFETLAVDHPDLDLTRRILHWRNDHHGGNNWSGRQLLRLATRAGLHAPQIIPVTSVARDEHANLTHSLWRAADVAREAGAISSEEHNRWIGQIKASLEAGIFFASMVYFIVLATRGKS